MGRLPKGYAENPFRSYRESETGFEFQKFQSYWAKAKVISPEVSRNGVAKIKEIMGIA